jgi:hypothetical protein
MIDVVIAKITGVFRDPWQYQQLEVASSSTNTIKDIFFLHSKTKYLNMLFENEIFKIRTSLLLTY